MSYVKEYFKRGLIFSGLGPVILGIVFLILQLVGVDLGLDGVRVFIAILSTYFLAFIQAGASVFHQIEEWSIVKSTALHFASLYVAYVICYLINDWIPFSWEVIAIFTAIFVVGYFIVWGIVYLIIKTTSDKLNATLNKD